MSGFFRPALIIWALANCFIANRLVTSQLNYDWMVKLTIPLVSLQQRTCAAVIVHPSVFLTTTKCFKDWKRVSSLVIHLGNGTLMSLGAGTRIYKSESQVYTAIKIFGKLDLPVLNIPEKDDCSDGQTLLKMTPDFCTSPVFTQAGWHRSGGFEAMQIYSQPFGLCLQHLKLPALSEFQFCASTVATSHSLCELHLGSPVVCTDPKDPDKRNYKLLGFGGDYATSKCNSGNKYHTPGIYLRICSEIDWLLSVVNLTAPETGPHCGLPPTVYNGEFRRTGRFNKLVLYCHPGFQRVLPVRILCIDGNWTAPGRCEPIMSSLTYLPDCGLPPRVPHGFFAQTRMPGRLRLVCDMNATLTGMKFTYCRNNTWTPHGFCEPRDACRIPYVQNGYYVLRKNRVRTNYSISLRDIVTLRCSFGFRPSKRGSATSTCVSRNIWKPPLSRHCDRISTCGEEPKVINGYHSGVAKNYRSIGSQLVLRCYKGHAIRGPFYVECLPTGNWSKSGLCLKCPRPPKLKNGQYTWSSSYGATVVKVLCNAGYRLSGAQFIQCNTDLTWTKPGRCVANVFCSEPPKVRFGVFIKQSDVHKVGDRLKIRCNGGFKRYDTDITIKCQANGNWSEVPDVCKSMCPGGASISSGRVLTWSDVRIWTSAKIQCRSGFVVKGTGWAVCMPGGTWYNQGQCVRVRQT